MQLPTLDDAVQSVIEIIQMGVPVARVEFMDAASVRAVNLHSKLTLRETPLLVFEFHGSPAGVQEQAETVQAITAEHGGMDFEWAERPEDRSRLWTARHNAYFAGLQLRPGCRASTTDVCVPISRLADCVRETVDELDRASFPYTIVGHVGDGNFHVLMLLDADSEKEWQESETINHNLVRRAIAADGTCTGEHGVGLHKMQFMAEEHGDNALELMRSLKHAFDPNNILNPGKIVSWCAPGACRRMAAQRWPPFFARATRPAWFAPACIYRRLRGRTFAGYMRERRFIRGCAVDAGKSRPASAQRARYCFIHELTGRNRPGASAAALFSAAIDRGPVGRVARALRAVSRRGHPPYECDGLSLYRALPAVVALPETEEQVQAVMRICKRLNAPVVARRRHRPVRRRHAAQPGRAAGSVRSIASAASIWPAPPPWSSPACATWRFPKRPLPTACTMRPIPPARSPVPLAATWPRIPAACIA